MTWAPDYCDPAELKAYARVPVIDELDDVQIGLAITAASRAIDDACRRQFGLVDDVSQPRFYTPEWDAAQGRYVVVVDDFMSVGEGFGVHVDTERDGTYATSVAFADFSKWPLNAAAIARPWERLKLAASVAPPVFEGSVRVSAQWGWTAVPDTIKQACLLQASRVLKRREAVFGVVGSPDMGVGETRLLDTLDADVALMVRAYRRAAAVA